MTWTPRQKTVSRCEGRGVRNCFQVKEVTEVTMGHANVKGTGDIHRHNLSEQVKPKPTREKEKTAAKPTVRKFSYTRERERNEVAADRGRGKSLVLPNQGAGEDECW